MPFLSKIGLLLAIFFFVSSCRQDMHDQPKLNAYRPSNAFADGTSARLPPAGTVPRGTEPLSELFNYGTENGHLAVEFPAPVTLSTMQRGRERYGIFCEPCHGVLGEGDGPVAQRGFFPRVANLQEEQFRGAAVGHIFGVITAGYNTMPAYAAAIPPGDRWAIVAYLKALQLSQNPAAKEAP